MEKIILDCDPGHDDAIAILLAAGNPNIDLLGITTVSGNHNVENTTRNALSVCTAYGIKVPVAKGSPGPLIIDQVLAIEIHGERLLPRVKFWIWIAWSLRHVIKCDEGAAEEYQRRRHHHGVTVIVRLVAVSLACILWNSPTAPVLE